MPKLRKSVSWVVFTMNVRGTGSGNAAVCEQDEWQAMELAQPGRHTLIQRGIANENEADQIARTHSIAQTPDKSTGKSLLAGKASNRK